MALTLITGGVRSGKSRHGAEVALSWGSPVVVIATAEALDDEMAARIARHRAERPEGWRTIEEPLDLSAAFTAVSNDDGVVLDCLTLWVSNVMGKGATDEDVTGLSQEVAKTAAARTAPVVAITNEVGWGIVPDNAEARRYTELLGRVNADWARAAEETLLMVAGRTVRL